MKIHYCWFGNSKKNELILRCIDSWRYFCPEAQIIEWNESNFDINICSYVREAYEQKKWSFVSDYCRYYVLYHCGGIYLDTDVELIKGLQDLPETFAAFEVGGQLVASGLIRGAKKGDSICKFMCSLYEHERFTMNNGQFNLQTVCERETSIFLDRGLDLQKNREIQIVDGTTIYPEDYFCPFDYLTGKLNKTKNTYSIHHYMGSWINSKDREIILLTRKLSSTTIPRRLAHDIAIVIKTIEYDRIYVTLKKVFKKTKEVWSRLKR